MSSLKQQLVAAISECFFDLAFISFNICDIAVGMARAAKEIAELAIGNADIGCVHIPVYLPGYFTMRYLDLTERISCVHQFGSAGILEKVNTFFLAEEIEIERTA